MRRLVISAAALAALATPASLFVVGVTTPAGATTPASLSCTKVSGSATGKVTISGCNVPTADKSTYASASAPKGLALDSGGTITWLSSRKTTVFSITHVVTGGTACKHVSGTGEVVATGKVTGGSAVVTKKTQVVSVSICLNKTTFAISIAPGTTAKL